MSASKPLASFAAQRLFVEARLGAGAEILASKVQANYLLNVLRLKTGDMVLLFNGRDGEWQAEITQAKRGTCRLEVLRQTRLQETAPDIHYLFAPLKRARLDYMVQKAAEMGVARLQPVLTERTQVKRVNLDRMRANVIEAAEQCGILHLPEIADPVKLPALLAARDTDRHLVFCDEAAEIASPIEALAKIGAGPISVLIGPEGGFSPAERETLSSISNVTPISLGPRVLRADTAAVAALALINTALGDWK